IPAEFDLQNYSYELPEELIAQSPLPQRDGSRLLLMGPTGKIEDALIKEIGASIDTRINTNMNAGDVLVLNNSKVIPMRMFGHKEANNQGPGGKVEILINSIRQDGRAEALIKASRPLHLRSRITIDDVADLGNDKKAYFEVVDITQRGENKLYLLQLFSDETIQQLCEKYGVMPLPPYIRRSASAEDRERYQTVYAKESGSAAAPTAGLHFSEELLDQLQQQGIIICELTLHVGIGTFTPIRSRDIRQHTMHPEFCNMPQQICNTLNEARAKGRKIIAVGTTSLRTLESFWDKESACFIAGEKQTNLYIYPGKEAPENVIHSTDILITNFHQPSSSLLLLVCAFGGYDKVMNAYKHAIRQRYRFFSYGDACLFHRTP
ncbi:MAG: tRNA preQ1(34) S-adenosylmethionine ribosyltransferase-isomerase QueA, partial [Gammaproteobacteria bacterium]|nr:tRNA preQ1(34) S-adenosylmethionine ribosyltransferase-isomerase QueA [Gammaproteobacteria bacterium]